MRSRFGGFLVFLLIGLVFTQTPTDAIMIYDIKALTFYRGQMTTAKRTTPIPQLTRVGGTAPSYDPDVAQCQNVGTDDRGNPQWKCQAQMPNNIRFGRLSVSCEGYNFSGDKLVLKGSCGLKYELNRNPFSAITTIVTYTGGYFIDETRGIVTFFFIVSIIGLILCILLCCCSGFSCCGLCSSSTTQSHYDPDTKTYTTVETSYIPTVVPIIASAPVFIPPYPSYGYSSTTIVNGMDDALGIQTGFGGTNTSDNWGGFGGGDSWGGFDSR